VEEKGKAIKSLYSETGSNVSVHLTMFSIIRYFLYLSKWLSLPSRYQLGKDTNVSA